MAARPSLAGLGVYVPGRPVEEVQRELGLARIIKLASNENPFGCPPAAREAMIQEMGQCALYPESSAPALAERIARHWGVDVERVFLGNGSDEIIGLLTRTYVQPGDEVVVADPTFSRYEQNVIIDGGVPVKVPCVDGVHDLDAMLRAVGPRTRMVFVCNPNNPTGTIVGAEALRRFIEAVPANVIVVVDEAYYEYVTASDYLQTVPLLDTHPNLIILRTFSKIYGLAALRIGYGLMHPAIIAELHKVRGPFNTNRLAQAAALAALDDAEWVRRCREANAEGLAYLAQAAAALGLSSYPSQGNFILIHLPTSGTEVGQRLLMQGVIVRPGEQLGIPNSIRVTVGTPEENQAFVEALRRAL
ncbi:MAG: histidinol-phosphate transaminase [Thermoflavifilum sp.]|nr:histidinol-phosphate transaminase [Thermoflavifilum sp.]MCL6514366.1 histidinol-phosphate transaminase [Alicyclobacillus sp.]